MKQSNYFEFFDIPIAFILDIGMLKKRFYINSKKYHPDFYTLESEEKQAEILECSTLNNEAYKTLSDEDKRMRYVLELFNVLEAEGQNKLPQSFLMEMMEINEALMELEFDFDETIFWDLQKKLNEKEATLKSNVLPFLEKFDSKNPIQTELSEVKNYYLKKRYLLRIQENLSKFATR